MREHTLRHAGYQKIVIDWGCTKCSTSFMILQGLHDCTTRFKMDRYNTDGSFKDSVSRSVKQIMENLRWNGHKVFILVAVIEHGKTSAFFSNVIQGIEPLAYNWIRHAAAQIFWNLRRRLIGEDDIKSMVAS